MRAARLVSLVLLLQAHGRQTAAELAARLEVSERTVYRDLDALSEAGVPVYAERGRGGGCRLVDGYRTTLTGLSRQEADALLLAGVPGAAADLGLGPVAAAAQLKVLAALPDRLRATALLARQRFHLDAPDWFRSAPAHPALEAVASAVWNDRRVRLAYERGDGSVVRRTVDPLGLVLKGGAWYLVARVGRDERIYRVSRVRSARSLDEGFERAPDFDLAARWGAAAATFEASLPRYPVSVRATPAGRAALERVAAWAARDAGAGAPDPGRPGWLRLELDFERLEYAASHLLRLGVEVEVLAPAALRARLARTARDVAALYAGADRRASRAASRAATPGND
ncbi:MAG TPA: WYL domain-containing protein [Myxococcota bacterium]|jgi:predicted DNA-binding transcriptional regulator YafY|nr:WYL domain-containing protein [Myxococcota bacterium]